VSVVLRRAAFCHKAEVAFLGRSHLLDSEDILHSGVYLSIRTCDMMTFFLCFIIFMLGFGYCIMVSWPSSICFFFMSCHPRGQQVLTPRVSFRWVVGTKVLLRITVHPWMYSNNFL